MEKLIITSDNLWLTRKMIKQSRNDETLPNLIETYKFNTNFINPKK
jgi:hypothetical protein